jgi:uncharacterized delta-60 repeat protein
MKTNDSNLILRTGKSLRFLNTLFLSAARRTRRSLRRGFAIGPVVIMLLVAWNPQMAKAADGGLDPTFGQQGRVKTDFHQSNDLAYGMALQPDGKMVVAGISFIGISAAGGDFAVARYNADGTLDSSFGIGGKVTTDFGLTDQASSVVVQPDGKIIVAGGTYPSFPAGGGQFALARYNSDGSLDTSFGVGGLVRTSFGSSGCFASALVLQRDGKIIAGGTKYIDLQTNSDFGLVRYNSDGSLDSSFGNGGEVSTEFDGLLDNMSAVLVQPNGKLIAVGAASSSITSFDFALVRYLSNGTIDTTFGSAGKVRTDFGGSNIDMAFAAALQPDGKIVAAGTNTDATGSKVTFAIARYNSNGTLDPTFDSTGRASVDFGSFGQAAEEVLLQSDGKIVTVGFPSGSEGSDSDFLLARLNANGSLDRSFGVGGKVRTSFGNLNGGASAAVLQGDGKIVAAGFQATSTQKGVDIAMARYLDSVP